MSHIIIPCAALEAAADLTYERLNDADGDAFVLWFKGLTSRQYACLARLSAGNSVESMASMMMNQPY